MKITKKKKKIEDKICASRNAYRGKLATSVVGTFKNGSFHGPGKVIFEDGDSLISNFKNGRPAGVTRLFNIEGKLRQLSYEDVMMKGYKWTILHSNYLFYTDVSSFFNNHNDTIGEITYHLSKFKCIIRTFRVKESYCF